MRQYLSVFIRVAIVLPLIVAVGLLAGLVIGGILIGMWQATLPLVTVTINAWTQMGIIAAPGVWGVLRIFYFCLYWFALFVAIGTVVVQPENL